MVTEVHVVRAFHLDDREGNLVAVVADADGLGPGQKQRLASAIGVPETAFVSGRAGNDLRLECFGPDRPLATCGRAAIAAFSLLPELGRIDDGWHSVDTAQGRREIRSGRGEAWLALPSAKYAHVLPESQTERQIPLALGLHADGLLAGHAACRADAGGAYLLVPVRDAARLAAIVPDAAAVNALSQRLDVIGLYAFAPEPPGSNHAATARLIAPLYGLHERVVAEHAAGALGCYLREHMACRDNPLAVEQRSFRPGVSALRIDVAFQCDGDRLVRVLVGGRIQPMRRFRFEV